MAIHQSFKSAGDRAGLALIATAGLASGLSTFVLLSYIIWNAFLTREKATPLPRGIRSFTRSSLGCYLLSLLFCDFLQGSAFAINYRWSADGGMTEGRICTVQGLVSEIGDLGAAIWSIAISFHTFCLLFLVRKPHRLIAPIVLVCGWSILIVLPILGPTIIQTSEKGSFYGLSGAWCWLGVNYGMERLIYLYIWVFTALGTSVIIYTLIYLRFSNLIAIGDDGKLVFHFRRHKKSTVAIRPVSVSQTGTRTSQRVSTSALPGCFDWAKDVREANTTTSGTGSGSDQISTNATTHISKHLKQVARRLMWYPVLYTVVVLPVSICRMGVLAGWTPPFGLFVFAGICFAGSGVTNVILFITTRHSFIREVARARGTRVHITTQRITVREEGVELKDLTVSTKSPTSPKSPYFKGFEIDGRDALTCKEQVSIISHDRDSEGEDVEQTPGIRVTVFGRES